MTTMNLMQRLLAIAAVLGYLVTSAALADQTKFLLSQEIHTDLGPISVTTEDVNHDGNLDLAVGHDRSFAVSTLLGSQNGIFALTNSTSIGKGFNITTDDFNGDSNIDLLTAGENRVAVRLGNGDGSFGGGSSYSLPGPSGSPDIYIVDAASGDFNEDGHQDIVAAGFREFSVAILFGDGTGYFSLSEYLIASISGLPGDTFLGISGVKVGDFDEDTHLDVVALNATENRVFVFFGNGEGLFSPPVNLSAGGSARSLSVDDINVDNHADIIVAGSVAGMGIHALLGDGAGGFVRKDSPGDIGTSALTIAIADFNQDGNLDIAAPNFSGTVDVVLGDGEGLFTISESIFLGGRLRSATSGDFNKDGYPDFAVANNSSGKDKVHIFLNDLVLKVDIDIKPGSDPNCFNINGHGVIPVAILGTQDFDVSNIDVTSLLFAGLDVRVRGNKGPLCAVELVNGDSYLDMVCQFEDDASSWVLGNSEAATLTGKLMDGSDIQGTDSICIVP